MGTPTKPRERKPNTKSSPVLDAKAVEALIERIDTLEKAIKGIALQTGSNRVLKKAGIEPIKVS